MKERPNDQPHHEAERKREDLRRVLEDLHDNFNGQSTPEIKRVFRQLFPDIDSAECVRQIAAIAAAKYKREGKEMPPLLRSALNARSRPTIKPEPIPEVVPLRPAGASSLGGRDAERPLSLVVREEALLSKWSGFWAFLSGKMPLRQTVVYGNTVIIAPRIGVARTVLATSAALMFGATSTYFLMRPPLPLATPVVEVTKPSVPPSVPAGAVVGGALVGMAGAADRAQALYEDAVSLMEPGSYEKAIAGFTAALRLRPDWADAYYNRAVCYQNLEKFEEAIKDFTEVIRREKPPRRNAYYNRAMSYMNLEQLKEAEADLTNYIKNYPKPAAKAFTNRAKVRQQLGDSAGAKADREEAAKHREVLK